jgi:type I restriction enzyme, S subunit
MSEWQQVKLKEVTVKIGSGATPKGGSGAYKENGISLIRSQNVLDYKFSTDGLAFIDDEQANALKNVIVEENDILLNITGDSVARCCSAPVDWLPARVNQHVAIIRANPNLANSDFIKYHLLASKEELLILSEIGGTRNALTKAMIEDFTINFPPLPEQQAIASVLSSLDDKIDLLHRQNKTLEAMAETLFRQWFIEEAKDDWEELALKELVKVIDNRGKTPPYQDFKTEHPIIEVNALTNDGRLVNYSVIRKFVDDSIFQTWFRQHLEDLDILFSTVGSIGSIGMFFKNGACVAQNVIGIRAMNKISNFYLYQWLLYNQEEIRELDIGSVQPSIKVPHLLALQIRIPDKNILDKFDLVIKGFIDKLKSNQERIQTLENLRDTLLPKLMSGEIRVKVL